MGELIPLSVDIDGNHWSLFRQAGAQEPVIRDLDWAERLGYRHPLELRRLVRSLAEAGKLGTVLAIEEAAGPKGGRPGTTYYLTAEQACLVGTQSNTPGAWEMTRAMVRVFLKVMSGQRVAPAPAPRTIARPTDIACAWARAYLETSDTPLALGAIYPHWARWTMDNGHAMSGHTALAHGMRSAGFEYPDRRPPVRFLARLRDKPLEVVLPQVQQQELPLPTAQPGPRPARIPELLAHLELHPPGLTKRQIDELVGDIDIGPLVLSGQVAARPQGHTRMVYRHPKFIPGPAAAIEDRVRDWLSEINPERVTTTHVIEGLGLPHTRAWECRVGRALTALGYQRQRTRIDGEPQYSYTKPEMN